MALIDRDGFAQPIQRCQVRPGNDRFNQFLQTTPVQTAHANHTGQRRRLGKQIDFIQHDDFAARGRDLRRLGRGIHHAQDHIRLLHMCP